MPRRSNLKWFTHFFSKKQYVCALKSESTKIIGIHARAIPSIHKMRIWNYTPMNLLS